MEENIKSSPLSEDIKNSTINSKIEISENPVCSEDDRMETKVRPNLMNGSPSLNSTPGPGYQSLNSTPGPGYQSLNSTPGPIRIKNLLLDQSRTHQVYFNGNIKLNFKCDFFSNMAQNIIHSSYSAESTVKIFFISK